MKKTLLTIAALGILCFTLNAQEVDKATVTGQADAAQSAGADLKAANTGEKDWKFSGVIGLNASATALVNWAAGGSDNVNGVAYGKFRLLYHKNNIAWDTNLDMEYGLSWINQEYDPFQKSSDKINLATKFGWEFHKTWYLTALAGFQSQFAYGRSYDGTAAYDPIISKFLAPSYTDISVGIDWKPNDIFSIYLSPIAGRLTTVYVSDKLNQKIQDEQGYNLEENLKETYAVWKFDDNNQKSFDKNLRAELGLSFKGAINYTYKDLKIITSLGLFTPYAWDKTPLYLTADGITLTTEKTDNFFGYRDNNRRFGHFDVDWDVAISYQFLKCLQVTLSTSLKYYNGVLIADKEGNNPTERVQFKSVLGLGVGYSF